MIFDVLTIFSKFAFICKNSFPRVERRFIKGIWIAYDESGKPEGKPVVILHGWGCNHTTVKSIARILESGMRVISVDLPGHGESEEPPKVWGTRDYSDAVWQLLHDLRVEKPSLIGHSFGGRTSIAMAVGKDVEKIVLVDSAGITPRRTLKYYYKVYTYKTFKKILTGIFDEERARRILDKSRKGSADYQAASPRMRAVMSKCINEDLKSIMPAVNAPVLLIWGENDTATPLSDAKTMEKLIPDAGLVSFPGCGHYSFLDNPIGFQAVVREFFKNELKG